MSRRRVIRVVLVAVVLVLLAHPWAAADTDVFENTGPQSQVGSSALVNRHALSHYGLDYKVSGINASLTDGIDISGVPALIAYTVADLLWQLTTFLANAVITLFQFAFSLDLLNGSAQTNGQGALAPIARAVSNIYTFVFGESWMVAATVLAGAWAMWKALVQRRYAETAGALGLSLIYIVIALAFVTQPQQTIGRASRWTNDMSTAFLSLTNTGEVKNTSAAKNAVTDQLFALLIYDPWVVLDFGGVEHCVAASNPSVSLPTSGSPAGKTCIDNRRKYAEHALAYAPSSADRNVELAALRDGNTGELPDSDPAKKNGTYPLAKADKPAGDFHQKDSQFQRLEMAIVVFLGDLGAVILLGALSIAVILAQLLTLLLLAFAPVALVVGIFPGRGHDLFRGWLARLATFLLRKAYYSLILAVLLAVAAALQDASSNLGWLMAYGLQALFFWAVFLYRKEIVGQFETLSGADRREGGDLGRRLRSVYYSRELLRGPARSARRAGSAALAGGGAAAFLATRRPPSARENPRHESRRGNHATAAHADGARRNAGAASAPRNGANRDRTATGDPPRSERASSNGDAGSARAAQGATVSTPASAAHGPKENQATPVRVRPSEHAGDGRAPAHPAQADPDRHPDDSVPGSTGAAADSARAVREAPAGPARQSAPRGRGPIAADLDSVQERLRHRAPAPQDPDAPSRAPLDHAEPRRPQIPGAEPRPEEDR